MTGFDSKRTAALDKLAEVTEEMGLYKESEPIVQRAEEAYESAKECGWVGISDELLMEQPFALEVKLMDSEVLRVTKEGQFVWHPDADRMIEEGDFSFSPALPHILRALRKREWVGLTMEEIYACDEECNIPQYDITNADLQSFAKAIEAKLKEKNTP